MEQDQARRGLSSGQIYAGERNLSRRAAIGFALAGFGLLILSALWLPPAYDWEDSFRPAIRAFWQGKTPYGQGFYNPPYTLFLLTPFLGPGGRVFFFGCQIMALAWVAVRMEASPLSMSLFLTSPPVLHSLLMGNLEWLVLLGLLMPPQWGLFMFLIKPQVGAGMAALTVWKERSVKILLPLLFIFMVSLIMYGAWPLQALDRPSQSFNAVLPHTSWLGLCVLAFALGERSERAALIAAPLLSPFVIFYSWSGALCALVSHTKLTALVVALLWLRVVLVR